MELDIAFSGHRIRGWSFLGFFWGGSILIGEGGYSNEYEHGNGKWEWEMGTRVIGLVVCMIGDGFE